MRCITIKNYSLNSPVFIVGALGDRAFNNGFRIVNPDFNATRTAVALGEDDLKEYLDRLDSDEVLPGIQRQFRPQRQRDPNRRTI